MGIIIQQRTKEKIKLLPGAFSFAKEYPYMKLKKIPIGILIAIIIIEFPKNCIKGIRVKANFQFDHSKPFGRSVAGNENMSRSELIKV